jgi:hypothetical protein
MAEVFILLHGRNVVGVTDGRNIPKLFSCQTYFSEVKNAELNVDFVKTCTLILMLILGVNNFVPA